MKCIARGEGWECQRDAVARGLCDSHWRQWRTNPERPLRALRPWRRFTSPVCTAKGDGWECGRKVYGIGLCTMHYGQHFRGEPLSDPWLRSRPRKLTNEEVAAHMFTRARLVDECIEVLYSGDWHARPSRIRIPEPIYGMRQIYPHRLAAWFWHGPAPDPGMFVRHLCGNHRCIRPRHLAYGTAADNARDTKLHLWNAWPVA